MVQHGSLSQQRCLFRAIIKVWSKMSAHNKNFLLLLLLLLTALAACASVRITPPEVELAGLEVTGASITHLNFNASIRIFNPNRHDVRIGAVSYQMELGGKRIFSSVTYVDDVIGAGKSLTVPLRVSAAFWDIVALFTRLGSRPDLDFRLYGSIEAGPVNGRMGSFEFERNGSIVLDPEEFRRDGQGSENAGRNRPGARQGREKGARPGAGRDYI